MSQSPVVHTSEAWNICPSCNELTGLPDFEQPGTPLTCTSCSAGLVAECFGSGDDTEWKLILASEYYDDDGDESSEP